MRVLLAFDKFKDALTAKEACHIAMEVLSASQPESELIQAPLTDGGEGFARILAEAVAGEIEIVTVLDPLFAPIDAALGWIDLAAVPARARDLLGLPATGRLAIVEMAQASGLELLPPSQRDPRLTSTFGTGQLIAHAGAEGADAILLGIGGSATNDLGLGALEALGLIAYDREMQPVRHITPAKWDQITSLEGLVNARQKLPPLRIACDVKNPLLGDRGATAVYGTQKGLRDEHRSGMEQGLHRQALRLMGLFGHDPATFADRLAEPGSGAAGGIAFGLRQALPETRFVAGFELVEAWLDLRAKIKEADIVVTGEGRFDASSLDGKGPVAILRQAIEAGREVHVFAGSVGSDLGEQLPAEALIHPISPPELLLPQALSEAPVRLATAIHAAFAG